LSFITLTKTNWLGIYGRMCCLLICLETVLCRNFYTLLHQWCRCMYQECKED
jgi:hypothetical protein